MEQTERQVPKSSLQRRIERSLWLILALVVFVGLAFFSEAVALGIATGGLVSIGNYYWLARDMRLLIKKIAANEGGAGKRALFVPVAFARLIATAVALYIAAVRLGMNAFGLIAGLSVVVIAIVYAVMEENFGSFLRRFRKNNASLLIF